MNHRENYRTKEKNIYVAKMLDYKYNVIEGYEMGYEPY